MNKNFWKPKGFMALVSVLVISSISLVIVTSMSLNFVSESRVISEGINTNNAFYLANACAEEGLMRFRRDVNYSSGSFVIDTNHSCNINIVNNTGVFILTATGNSYESSKQIQINYAIDTQTGLRDEFNEVHTRHNLIINSWEKT